MDYLKDFDLMPFYKWFADWIERPLEEIMQEDHFHMISDWLDVVSVKAKDSLGKEVYFGVNQEHKNELTYDVWLEGISIVKGIVTDVEETNSVFEFIVTINGQRFIINDCYGELFSCKEHAILKSNYDGSDLFKGNIPNTKYNIENLVKIEC